MDQGDNRVEPVERKDYMQPDRVVEKNELKKLLTEALETLTEKERRVMLMYYYEDMTLKEISQVLEVSESRVSQLHSKSLAKLKQKLGSNMELFLG